MNNYDRITDKKRIVIYARVSTEHEAQISALENQVDWYQPILDLKPEWILIESYIDRGITGTSAEKRPEFMRMIEDAKKKKFDMIITREVSRFARNTVDTLKYTRELKDLGVEVFFLSDNIRTFDCDGELRLAIMATLAQDESRKTSIRVKSGQQTSMEKGVFYGNGNILGYTRKESYLSNGKKQVDFVINEEQAETVRLMFNMYLNGCGLKQIKSELERRGLKTAMNKENWHVTKISHVLQNSFYCGIITYRKEYVPDYLTQKKIRNHGEVEQIKVEGKHEPIITIEDYERVQAIMETRRSKNINIKTGYRIGKNPRTIVWGKLLLCECGNEFSLRGWKHGGGPENSAYLCYSIVHNGSYSNRQKRGLSTEGYCQTPMVPIWKLRMIFYFVLNFCKNELASIISNYINNDNTKEEYENKFKIYQELQEKIDALIELRSNGDLSSDSFIRKSKELDNKLNNLELELKTYNNIFLENRTITKEELSSFMFNINKNTPSDNFVEDNEVEKYISKIKVSKERMVWCLKISPNPIGKQIASFTISSEQVRNYFKIVDGKEYNKKRIKDYEIFIEI